MSLGSASNFFLGAASATGGGAYEIERSLRFNSDDSAYLSRTPSSASNRRTWTWSGWVKRSSLGSRQQIFGAVTSGSVFGSLEFNGLDSLTFYENTLGSSSVVFTTNRIFRDISAWYHIVLALDTTQTTASDRVKLYVNGAQETSFSAGPSVVADGEGLTNSTTGHNIGSWTPASSSLNLNAYLAETHFVDGQQLAASDFGEYDSNNVWQPKEFTGTYDRGANQSQVWSTATTVSFYGSTQNGNTSTIADVFDGSETTGYYVLDSSATGPGLCYKLTFPSGVRGSRVRFRTGGDAGAAAALNTEVVGDLVGGSSYTWYTIYEGAETDIDYIVFGNNDSGGTRNNISNAIEIDGKLLVDSGISLTDNSFYLNFSDNSSNAALGTDSSGNGNDWTVNNIEAVAAFGIENACSIYGPSYETFSFPITYTTTVTFEAFVRVTTSVSYNYLAYNSSNNWNLGITTNSVLFGDFTGGYTTFTGTNVDDGDWHFLRLTTDGSNTSLYIDGTLHATNASGGNVSTGTEVTNEVRSAGTGRMRVAYMRITTGGTPPTTGIPALADMNQPAGTGGTLAFFDKLDDIAGSGTKTSDGGNVTITMAAATVATDQSGTDSLIDSPTNYEAESGNNGGNYCTINPLDSSSTSTTTSNGNLDVNITSNSSIRGSFYVFSGKWYYEVTVNTLNNLYLGLAGNGGQPASYSTSDAFGVNNAGDIYKNGSNTGINSVALTASSTFGIAFDADNQLFWLAKDGQWYSADSASSSPINVSEVEAGNSGYDFSSLSGDKYAPHFGNSDTAGAEISVNFGQRPFAYTPPTGYVSLCTQNFANPTITDGGTAMNAALYTGNGASNSITGLGFSPDILWIKSRSNATFPALANSVVGPNYFLRTNGTNAESGPGYNDDIVSFDSDGFTLGADTYYAFCNTNTYTYVAWAWDSGTTTGSNTDGTITSQVRANQSTGCSVVSYTSTDVAGATVGHGLNAVMDFAIFKNRDRGQNWLVYHKSLDITSGIAINLNQTNAAYSSQAQFNSTLATSSVFTLGTGGNASNAAGDDIIAFCFASVEGYSAFGSYTGNGSANGPFVYTGFKPKWILLKESSAAGNNWNIYDTSRDEYNVVDAQLKASSGAAEATNTFADYLSNGFKIRSSAAGLNTNAQTFIYAAFAEHPFKTARAR